MSAVFSFKGSPLVARSLAPLCKAAKGAEPPLDPPKEVLAPYLAP